MVKMKTTLSKNCGDTNSLCSPCSSSNGRNFESYNALSKTGLCSAAKETTLIPELQDFIRISGISCSSTEVINKIKV